MKKKAAAKKKQWQQTDTKHRPEYCPKTQCEKHI